MKHLLSLSLLIGFVAFAGCDQAGLESLEYGDATTTTSEAVHSSASTCLVPTLANMYNRSYPSIGDHATMNISPSGIRNEIRIFEGQYRNPPFTGSWTSQTINMVEDGGYHYDDDSKVAASNPGLDVKQYRVRRVCGGTVSGWSNIETVQVDPAY